MVIAFLINVIGDLALVAGFHLGAAGAAIATVFAQALSVALSLAIIRKRGLPFAFSLKYIRPKGGYIKHVLKLGTPIATQDLLANMSFLVIIAIVNGLGLIASAGVGVAEKMCVFLMLLPSAYMQSMSAFVAQNMGAVRLDRARKALLYGILSSLAVGLVVGSFTFFHGNLLASIFAKDTEIILAAAAYLKAYAIDCVLTPFLFCFMGYFNGCGHTTFVMLQGVICAFSLRIPISWFMSRQVPVSLFHIGLAIPAATVVQIILCIIFFMILLRKQMQYVKE